MSSRQVAWIRTAVACNSVPGKLEKPLFHFIFCSNIVATWKLICSICHCISTKKNAQTTPTWAWTSMWTKKAHWQWRYWGVPSNENAYNANNKRSTQWQMTFILIDFCLYVSSIPHHGTALCLSFDWFRIYLREFINWCPSWSPSRVVVFSLELLKEGPIIIMCLRLSSVITTI